MQAVLSSSQQVGVESAPFQLQTQSTTALHGLLREEVAPLQADPVHRANSLRIIKPKKY